MQIIKKMDYFQTKDQKISLSQFSDNSIVVSFNYRIRGLDVWDNIHSFVIDSTLAKALEKFFKEEENEA